MTWAGYGPAKQGPSNQSFMGYGAGTRQGQMLWARHVARMNRGPSSSPAAPDYSSLIQQQMSLLGHQPRPDASLLYTQASDPINARMQSIQQNFQRTAAAQGMSAGAIGQQNIALALQGAGQLGQAAVNAGVEGNMGQDITLSTVDRRTRVLMEWYRKNQERIAEGRSPLPYPADELSALGGG